MERRNCVVLDEPIIKSVHDTLGSQHCMSHERCNPGTWRKARTRRGSHLSNYCENREEQHRHYGTIRDHLSGRAEKTMFRSLRGMLSTSSRPCGWYSSVGDKLWTIAAAAALAKSSQQVLSTSTSTRDLVCMYYRYRYRCTYLVFT